MTYGHTNVNEGVAPYHCPTELARGVRVLNKTNQAVDHEGLRKREAGEAQPGYYGAQERVDVGLEASHEEAMLRLLFV